MSIEVYLTNLGKYNEGYLIGRFVKLPINEKDLQEVLKEIGIDGVKYEEYFITDVETDITGLSETISEYTSIRELNELAERFCKLNESDSEKLTAILESERYGNIYDIIKTIDELDEWELYSDIEDEESLGRLFADEYESLSIPENVKPYFDYQAYGRDLRLELNCSFTTYGLIVDNR